MLDYLSDGYKDSKQIAEDTCRTLGLSACEVLEEQERRAEIADDLQTICEALTPLQKDILLLTGAGYTQSMISELTNLSKSTVGYYQQSLQEALQNYSDEDRIKQIEERLKELEKTSRGRHSSFYKEYREEYKKRYSVRQALKRLLVNLTPPQSQSEARGKTSTAYTYPYEQAQNACVGVKKRVLNGYHIISPDVKCTIPEYLKETGCESSCMLCSACKRKKDIEGRAGYAKFGYEKCYDDILKDQQKERDALVDQYRSEGLLPAESTAEWELFEAETRAEEEERKLMEDLMGI